MSAQIGPARAKESGLRLAPEVPEAIFGRIGSARTAERPAPWVHKKKAISVDKINRQIGAWAAYLGLADWNIAFSPERVEKDSRSNVDINPSTRTAAIRLHSKTPTAAWDRQIVHELLHVLMSGMEDPFDRAVALLPGKARPAYNIAWVRGQEWVIERLTDIVVGVPRIEFEANRTWRTAFPP